MPPLRRRSLLRLIHAGALGTCAPAVVGLAACGRGGGSGSGGDGGVADPAASDIEMRWVGAAHERGHRLRSAATAQQITAPWPGPVRRAAVLVLGAGVAGLAAARAFTRHGVDDVHVLELEDTAGGNARAHTMGGTACPLGAHYLPVPGPQAREVSEWLHEIGLLHTDAGGRVRADERHLCHSPQERLFFEGQWVEGLLPPAAPGTPRLAQYRRFAGLVSALQRPASPGGGPAFALPAHRAAWNAELAALEAQTFASWLASQGLQDPALTTYLDYCCRDDYGAGATQVSAWAGVHYFASRHGFTAPGGDGEGTGGTADAAREGVFTWPEGNAWLTQRLAAPLGTERLHTGQTVLAVREEKHHVAVLAFDERRQALHAWHAGVVVMALPLFVAQRLVQPASAALRSALESAAAVLVHAPWLVANLQLDRPLLDRATGAPPAWDNVVHGGRGLGYVDATHQRLSPLPASGSAPVLTAYHAIDIGERAALLDPDARPWGERVLAELAQVHPDLRRRVQRIDLMRYGHAMAVPRPGVHRHAALTALRATRGRLRFAHGDLAGYSVFEEAFTAGSEVAAPVGPRG
ncbi:MAG: FAD-dependent oxidoreductase [Rubrivivax sp.]|nr:FAD-dependent oxidoreductase [Rubrivivax sp.]